MFFFSLVLSIIFDAHFQVIQIWLKIFYKKTISFFSNDLNNLQMEKYTIGKSILFSNYGYDVILMHSNL